MRKEFARLKLEFAELQAQMRAQLCTCGKSSPDARLAGRPIMHVTRTCAEDLAADAECAAERPRCPARHPDGDAVRMTIRIRLGCIDIACECHKASGHACSTCDPDYGKPRALQDARSDSGEANGHGVGWRAPAPAAAALPDAPPADSYYEAPVSGPRDLALASLALHPMIMVRGYCSRPLCFHPREVHGRRGCAHPIIGSSSLCGCSGFLEAVTKETQ